MWCYHHFIMYVFLEYWTICKKFGKCIWLEGLCAESFHSWHPWNSAGISTSARVFLINSAKGFCWNKKGSKMLSSCTLPTALTKSYTTAVRFVQAWSQATRDTSKSAQEQKGSRNFCISSHVGCIWSAQAADLNCLLCFTAVINMASKIKWPESCCWPRHGC